ncbi:hypothetical protein FB45DRAFT_931421 [Roridomyces roridus]|uniref:Polyketide synthase n=1 Tax=Roridomyces roridus TaxID=1738132 RepID=A0AAD7FEU6_9AGAR|nr:hypothetical protein FB45DRAFT_931421 [Roridomyces roridus]
MYYSRSIAVIGISTALPSGAHSDSNLDHDDFFRFLMESKQSYELMPDGRFNSVEFLGPGVGQLLTNKGSFLKDIHLFDHLEFGVSYRDARAMAPATRLLLEQAFLALSDAGIDYRNRNVGCYTAGTSIELMNVGVPDPYEPRGAFSGVPSMISNRISSHLDLLGPSVAVDTACSSSLTAFHLAVQGILSGDCEAAVVGGCQLNHRVTEWVAYTQSGILSEDGKCKPFDESANGFARAEGCVAVVLKPYEDAIRDNDRVYATVLGTSSNSTGGGGAPGVPVAEAQLAAMQTAFKRARKAPTEIDFVEAHATGTAKGDPTEANWVGEHFCRRDGEVLVGSVKGNIGHTEITSFLASLSKVLSIFEHGVIPPNVNLETRNPAIQWEKYRLHIPTTPTALPNSKKQPLIAMASSGIGGSNGHVVLQGPAPLTPSPLCPNSGRDVLLMAGGLSPRSAGLIAEQIAQVEADPRALSTMLGRRAKQMTWRSYAVVSGTAPLHFSKPLYCGRDPRTLVFVFSGQGPQHDRMGRDLFATFPAFRSSILEQDAVFQRVTGTSILSDYGLFIPAQTHPPYALPEIWPIALILPAIAMFQMAYFDLLSTLGIRPDFLVGHSAGETALLYASGASTKDMALELAIIRGRVLSGVESAGGTMAALSCSQQVAERLLAEYTGDDIVEIACLNSPNAIAIAGHERAIDEIIKVAHDAGILGRKLRTRVPIHSSMMELCHGEFRASTEDLFARYPGAHVPSIPTYSTLTGKRFVGPFTAEYFWHNTRSRVLFMPAIQRLAENATFVEIAPHPVLSSYLTEMSATSSTVLSTVRRPRTGFPSLENRDTLAFLGQLICAGHNNADFMALNGPQVSIPKLPPYPFSKKSFPLYLEPDNADKFYGPLNRPNARFNKTTHPILAQHIIRDEPIWPGAGFLEMALEYGATMLLETNFRAMLPLSFDEPMGVRINLDGSHWKITTKTPARNPSDTPTERLHAEGYLSMETPPACPDIDIEAIRTRCNTFVSDEFYPALSYFSTYGPKFQRVACAYYNAEEALLSIRGQDASLETDHPYITHPAIIDACFHIGGYRPFHGDYTPNSYYLPARIFEMILHLPSKTRYFPMHVYAHVRIEEWRPDAVRYRATIADGFGKVYLTMRFELDKHRIAPLPDLTVPLHVVKHRIPPNDNTDLLLFDEETNFVFHYRLGNEADLQWDLGGLNPEQELSVFIFATQGADANAGLGLARSLRREYPFWTLYFVSFPAKLSAVERKQRLYSLGAHLRDELDLFVTLCGEVEVPRLVPLSASFPKAISDPALDLELGQTRVQIRAALTYPGYSSFAACSKGVLMLGLAPSFSSDSIFQTIASDATIAIPYAPRLDALPGVVAALLAIPGLRSGANLIRPMSVLLTHADTSIGAAVSQIFADFPVLRVSTTTTDSSLLYLLRLGVGSFDLVVSGHEPTGEYAQILGLLVRPGNGKLFLWHSELARVVQEEPETVGVALRVAEDLGYLQRLDRQHLPSNDVTPNDRVLFRSDKTYLLVGGLGHIGAHVALHLVKNGARSLIVTSRSGKRGLQRPEQLAARRIYSYLDSLPNVRIVYATVDHCAPDSEQSLRATVDTASSTIAGCVILTGALSDGLFQTLGKADFSHVFAPKTGVLHDLEQVLDLGAMDFVAAFSSATGTFGTGGQTNYCAANTSVDAMMEKYTNGFSFISPMITDSPMIFRRSSHLTHLVDWGMSSEELMLWFDDALQKITSGVEFSQYCPDLDWGALDRTLGMPKLGRHLLPKTTVQTVIQAVKESNEEKASHIVQKTLNISASDFDLNVPLTAYGIDSLSSGRLSFALRSVAQVTQLQLMADNSLADILRKFGSRPSVESMNEANPLGSEAVSGSVSSAVTMSRLVTEFETRMATVNRGPSSVVNTLRAVLVTGTTGALGSHLLADLLSHPEVVRVYALNRRGSTGVDVRERQVAAFAKQGLDVALVESEKLVLVVGDLEREDLGLADESINELSNSVSHIIHNAWTVDFYAQLAEFQPHIVGTEHLLRFATRCSSPASFSFISTVGTTRNASSNISSFPETILPDPSIAVQDGYCESKWISERYVQIFAEKGYLNTNVIRVGMLAGSASGVWETTQWPAILVRSGREIGCLPAAGGDCDSADVSWLSLPVAATAIVEMQTPQAMNRTLHVVHPEPVHWDTLFRPLAKALGVPLVPYPEWFARLKAAEDVSALKLLDMWATGLKPRHNCESMGLTARVSGSAGKMFSPTLNGTVPSLGEEDVQRWLAHWTHVGFL